MADRRLVAIRSGVGFFISKKDAEFKSDNNLISGQTEGCGGRSFRGLPEAPHAAQACAARSQLRRAIETDPEHRGSGGAIETMDRSPVRRCGPPDVLDDARAVLVALGAVDG